MRLLICAGGTGGGVYPALAVLQAMQVENNGGTRDESGSFPKTDAPCQPTVLWVGGVGGMESDLVRRAGIPFKAVPAAGVHGVGARALPGNLLQLGRGYREARRALREFQPDVLFFTGGYVAVPMALAGWRTPSVLYVPDIEPGLALKTLGRFSNHIAVTAEASRAFFHPRANVTVTGYPARPNLKSWSDEDAHQALGLEADLPTLLVFGGSKGARSINRALINALPDLLVEIQVVHISGKLDWPEVEAVRAALAEKYIGGTSLVHRYRPFPYLHEEMGAALTAADLVLSRAGASILGEYPLFGLPAILVPYPYAWRYQHVNAQYLVQRGAATVIEDDQLPDRLLPVVLDLMRSHPKREQMSHSMRSLASPKAANLIAQILMDFGDVAATKG